jgi:hypothetical protein
MLNPSNRKIKLDQIIDVRKWPRRKMNVGYGTREKIVLKQTKWGKVYFMAKTYGKDIGELRSELCASTIGRVFSFPVQKTWFCILPSLKMFPHPLGVLVQLDTRRQRDTRRSQFKENLIHGADLIGLVDKKFTQLKSQSERRNAYTLEVVVKALRNYVKRNPNAGVVWEQFFELLAFDALIGGTDRHYNNWGILEKADNAQFIRLAPAFDNGISLLWKIDEYAPKFQRDLLVRRFITSPEAMFKKPNGGKYDLYGVLEALYSIPELKGSGIARKILNRLGKVKIGHLKRTMFKNIPQSKEFRSETSELTIVFEYAKIRIGLLRDQLAKIDGLYH